MKEVTRSPDPKMEKRLTLRSLSNNDGDGYGNVTLKVSLRYFKLCRAYYSPSRLIRQMLAIFLELNSKGLHQISGKEKESCCLVFPSSTNRQIGHFHAVVVQ